MLEHLTALGMLILLQAVLGIDNLLYISLESRRAPADQQKRVRWIGIGLAIVLRIVLLFVLIKVIDLFKDPFFTIPENPAIHGAFNLHSVIVLAGGAFIIYTAVKEIFHMLLLDAEHADEAKPRSVNGIIFSIVLMNLVFSFDSILAAMVLTDELWVMAIAIVFSGVLMIWLSDSVSSFLAKNRMYEVLGLFILFIVGIMLLSEGGHLAHLKLFGNEITPMTKATFYFVIGVLVIIDVVQGRYQKNLIAAADARAKGRAGRGDAPSKLA